jgi:hypothetical protein
MARFAVMPHNECAMSSELPLHAIHTDDVNKRKTEERKMNWIVYSHEVDDLLGLKGYVYTFVHDLQDLTISFVHV